VRRFLLVLAALALGFAPAPFPKAERTRDKHQRLDGVWFVRRMTAQGTDAGVIHQYNALYWRRGDRLVISGGELRFTDLGRIRAVERWAIQIQHGSNGIDLLPTPGGRFRMLGIYRRDEGMLLLAFRDPGRGRPESFSDREYVILLKRR
jgi:hypothetical protein